MRRGDIVNRMLIGVGNPLGRDDGVGVYVAHALSGAPGWTAIPVGPSLENALGLVERGRPKLLVIVDAADMGLPPGGFRRLSFKSAPRMLGSTHALPLDFLLGLLRGAAREVALVGIQPRDLSLGEGLTPEVRKGADELIPLLQRVELEAIPWL
ncbi:TPA: hydrogenase 3 maturation endopeptidase HyCI [Candidatus Acetothermia bacterium]|nr:hydrogenase 3 maturation endopeptidase HyCI [Candidatus Acetothermia bacterium]